MKKSLSGLEIMYILKELGIVEGSRIDKIYHPDKKTLLLQFHVTGKGKHILKIIAGKFIFFTESKQDQEEPSGFCMFLRKHMGNTRLRSITQLESERIVRLEFEGKEKNVTLIAELFGQGNILLLEKGIILSGVDYQKFKDREIRPNVRYEYPRQPINIFNLERKTAEAILRNSEMESLVKSLAIEFGFGGLYAEEICLKAGVDKNEKPGNVQTEKILGTIRVLLDKETEAGIVYKGEAFDAVPFKLDVYKNLEFRRFPSFSKAIDHFLEIHRETRKTPKEIRIEKVMNIIRNQENKIEELKEKEIKERDKAEAIYQNYKTVDEILTEIKRASKKYSWNEIKKKLKGHKIIKSVNTKDKKIVVSLQE